MRPLLASQSRLDILELYEKNVLKTHSSVPWKFSVTLCIQISSRSTRAHEQCIGRFDRQSKEYWMRKYHCTIDLLFDYFGLVCFANKHKYCWLPHSWFQTSQPGGQWYNDTSPFSIPWIKFWRRRTFLAEELRRFPANFFNRAPLTWECSRKKSPFADLKKFDGSSDT